MLSPANTTCTTPRPPALLIKCRYREAVYSFQAAVRVQAADPLAHFRIGNALFALKKYADARKVSMGILAVAAALRSAVAALCVRM